MKWKRVREMWKKWDYKSDTERYKWYRIREMID